MCTELAGSSDNWPGHVVPRPLAWASHMGGVAASALGPNAESVLEAPRGVCAHACVCAYV